MKCKLTFLLLAFLAGAIMAKGTIVSVGETIPVRGTATTTTTETTTSNEEEAPSTEGSQWENLGIAASSSGSGVGVDESTAAVQNQPGSDFACLPALVLICMLALFARG